MIGNVQLFLFWSLLCASLYALLPRERVGTRRAFLVCVSALLVFAIAPWAAVTCALVTVLGWWIANNHGIAKTRHKLLLIYLVLLSPLALVKIWMLGADSVGNSHLLITLGIGFFVLKTIAAVLDAVRSRKPLRLLDLALLNFFFPIYSAGPIERVESFTDELLARTVAVRDVAPALGRMMLGLLKAAFIGEQLIGSFLGAQWPRMEVSPELYATWDLAGFVVLKFLYTYVNFSGYMDIAIGVGGLFGLRIMENFDMPLRAMSVQEFWKRWHLSLGQFVNQYVFLPLLLCIKGRYAPQLAIVGSFVAVGLWHELTPGYFFWGLMHGCALAWCITLERMKNPRLKRIRKLTSYRTASWVLTIFFVSWVQTVANMASFDAAMRLSLGLVSFGGGGG